MLTGHIWGGEVPQHWWQTVWHAVGKGVRVAARLGWRTALEALSGDEMIGHAHVPPRYYGQPAGVFEADRVVNHHLKKLAANRNLMGRLASGQPLETRQAVQLHAFTATLEARARTLREKQAAKLFGRHAKVALAGNLGGHGLPPAKGQRHFGNADKPPWVNWVSAADRVSSPFVGQMMVTPSWPDPLWRGVRNSVQEGADQIKLRDWHGLRWSGVKQPAKGQPKGQKGLVPGHIARAPTPETGYDSLVRSNDELNDGALAARQRTLNALFRGPVFSAPEIAHPKPQVMEKAVANRNIGQMIAVANWILWRKASSVWQSLELKDLQNKLQDRQRWISPAKERQLAIALKLNAILKRNEADESKRDDARAFADGLQVLIDTNSGFSVY
jgi:hypothetical protein